MEFLRFGSSIPGSYWGCCAVCIIQNFKFDPDEKASIQLVSGDGGGPITQNGSSLFAGPTYRDIFWQRIRTGTFDQRDMPNHAFLAVLTDWQVKSSVGGKWLAILKEAGFEFIRSVANSVYTGSGLAVPQGEGRKLNYIFGLFRNIGAGAPENPFLPPVEWDALPSVKLQAVTELPLSLAKAQWEADTAIWERIGPPKFLTEKEVTAAGAPVILAGLRSKFPQQSKQEREAATKAFSNKAKTTTADPFANAAAPPSLWKTRDLKTHPVKWSPE
jgi:hypothetical protein